MIILVLLHGEGGIIVDGVEERIAGLVESAPASAFNQKGADQSRNQSQEGGKYNPDDRPA